MDYLQSILDLDAAALADVERKGQPGAGPPQPVATLARIESLRAEVENAATMTAVSASVANALARPGMPPVSIRAFQTYAPQDLTGFHDLLRALIESGVSGQLAVKTQEFGRRLALARRMSEAFVAEARPGRGPGSVEPETLADAWNRTCRAARDLLMVLPVPAPEDGATREALIGLLDKVASGEAACVEPDGCVVVPGFAERRRHPRFALDGEGEICFGANVYKVRMIDASAGGFGIEGPSILLQGDAVTVKLPDGRKLRANVAWVNGPKAGLRLAEPLQASDPLLSHGALAGRTSAAA